MMMREQEEYIMRVTRKGQVTIPAAIRNRLGLKPNAQVPFRVEEGEVKLEPARATLAASYGAVVPVNRPEDFERIAQMGQEEQAERAAGRDE